MIPHYREFAPSPAIAHAVEAFWYFSAPNTTTRTDPLLRHRVLPDGCIDLIFRFQHPMIEAEITNPLLTVYGPTDRFKLIDIKPFTEFVGVRFKPGEAGFYLALSPLALFQQEVKAQDCSAHLANLFNQLCECGSAKQVLSILQKAMLESNAIHAVCDAPARVRQALRLLTASRGQMRVSDVAELVGVSERTLRRDIVAAVGLTPKMLLRILRFQRAHTLLHSKEPLNLCDIALESGYADQAHMGREFQEFAGLTPIAFVR